MRLTFRQGVAAMAVAAILFGLGFCLISHI
jgi:hypothetical protein